MHTNRFVLFALTASLVPALLAGCGGGSSTPATTAANGPVTSATRAYNNLQFTLSADKAIYTSREKPVITLMVKNIGTQAISLGYPSSAQYNFTVTQGTQIISMYPTGGSAGVLTSTIFAPGQTYMFQGSWDHLVEITGQYAPAGQYTITAWLSARSLNGNEMSASDAQTNLSANPITIQTQ